MSNRGEDGDLMTLLGKAAFVCCLAVAWAEAAGAEEPGGVAKDPAAGVREYVERAARGKALVPAIKDKLQNIVGLKDDVLGKAMPEFRFFVLSFGQVPVGMVLPAPLEKNNVFAVRVEGAGQAMMHMTTAEELRSFCGENLRAAGLDSARTAANAYVILRKELAQEGWGRIEIDAGKFDVRGTAGELITVKADVQIIVDGANEGSISASLSFAGPKGTCQVTAERVEIRSFQGPVRAPLVEQGPGER